MPTFPKVQVATIPEIWVTLETAITDEREKMLEVTVNTAGVTPGVIDMGTETETTVMEEIDTTGETEMAMGGGTTDMGGGIGMMDMAGGGGTTDTEGTGTLGTEMMEIVGIDTQETAMKTGAPGRNESRYECTLTLLHGVVT